MKSIFDNAIVREDMENIFIGGVDSEKLAGSTFLITGATGMLASYMVYYLIFLNECHNAGIKILAQGRNKDNMIARFGKYAEKSYFNFVSKDICDQMNVDEEIDYIVHTASLARPQYYSSAPVEVAEPNALGTYYLLRLAKEKAVKGFLYFSSGDVYGKVLESGNITEDTMGMINPLELHSCYGESKRMGETWCHLFAQEYGVPTKIARIAHTYGPTMDVENDPRVFASFMKNVVKGEDIILRSDGSAKRPFCYIVDAVVAFFLILLKGSPGEAYNVANNKELLSIKELAEIMISLSDNKKALVRINEQESCGAVENKDNKDNNLNTDKLHALGWRPKCGVEFGMRRVKKALRD